MEIINKLLRKEEIKRGDGKIYLHRWTIVRTSTNGFFSKIGLGDIRLYIHKFTSSDISTHHDHPSNNYSTMIKGSYTEEYYDKKSKSIKSRKYNAPCFRFFPASHIHRIIINRPCWTIVLMTKKRKEWGFYTEYDLSCNKLKKKKWIKWDEFNDRYIGLDC